MKRTNQRKRFQTIMATILSATMIAGLVPPQALAEMAEEAGSASWVSTENGAVLSASSEDGGAPIEGSSEDDTLQGDGNGEGLGDESQSETGALEVSFALQGVDEEDAANKSVRYILRNEEGAYFNNQDEWVDAADALVETEDGEWVLRDDLKLWIKAGQTVQVTGVPVGRYTVEELADDLAIEGYDLDGEASTLSLEVQVGTDVPAEAGLINAYQKVSEPEDVDATEEPAVPVARRGAKAPALRAGDGDDEEQEATLTDNLN